LAVADEFQLASVRRFAARMLQQGRLPGDVIDDDLRDYGTYLETEMIGVQVKPMLRRIVQLWRRAAAANPDWPQIPPKLDCEAKPFNPPFSAYPESLQNEIAAIGRWMEGKAGPFDADARKPLRAATIKLRLTCIRLIWELGQTRQQAVPEAQREHNPNGTSRQTDAPGVTLVMLAAYFDVAPDRLKEIQWLAKRMRKPPRPRRRGWPEQRSSSPLSLGSRCASKTCTHADSGTICGSPAGVHRSPP
jgi:hypothetical protein